MDEEKIKIKMDDGVARFFRREFVAQRNHSLLRDNRLHRQSITPTEHPTMAA